MHIFNGKGRQAWVWNAICRDQLRQHDGKLTDHLAKNQLITQKKIHYYN